MDRARPRNRRDFLAVLPAVIATALTTARGVRAAPGGRHHPEPRPGIDASRVTPRERLGDDVAPVFDMARAIPATFDGIGCTCGCAELSEMYSLLSCFEGDGMAQHCMICRGQARLVHRLHEGGRTLDQIRAAIDEAYG